MGDTVAIKFVANSADAALARGENDVNFVASPCVSVCLMDEATGWCQGCWRTLDEIRLWGQADAVYKRAVWAQIEARAAASDPLGPLQARNPK